MEAAWQTPTGPSSRSPGDGGFGQYLAELTTAVNCTTPVKHVLLGNGSLGKISTGELAADLTVWQTSLVNPDFAAYARSCGASGISARTPADLNEGMRELFAATPALLHIHAAPVLV